MDFTVYKSDRKKAIIADPYQCIEALGIRRNKNVVFAHIGSGADAYVGFRDGSSPTGISVKHFRIYANAAKVRDTFDQRGGPETQRLTLSAPTKGFTLLYRRESNKRRRAAIKAGSPVKKQESKLRKTRVVRLGVAHRPRPKIENGNVSFLTEKAA